MSRILQILDRQGTPVAEITPAADDEVVLPPGADYRMIEEKDED